MKILEINNFHYLRGGSESVYFNTAKLLEEKGHQVIFFSMQNPENFKSKWDQYFVSNPNFLNSSSIDKIKNVKKFFYNAEAKYKIEKLIKEEKPDIAHLHLFYGGLSNSILPILKKNNIPIVATLHDYKLLCPVYTFLTPQNEICEKCINSSYFHCIKGKCNKNNFFYSLVIAGESYFRDYLYSPYEYIDKFIFVSKFAYNKHIENKPKLKNKAEHLYNFYPLLNSNSPIYNKGNYFLFFGRLSYEKGLETLLNTWENLHNIKLKIAGNGPLKDYVADEVSKNKNIEYLGFQSGNELINLISKASFIIVPSEWYENNPMTIIEAYSLGKPVIGSNIGGIPEIVKENETGYLFKPNNTKDLREKVILANSLFENEYINLSKNARRFSEENFNKEIHYKKLMNIFESIL